MRTTHSHRDGDVLVTVIVETQPAEIDFADILDAVKVEPDDLSEAPWDNCDGYEHRLRPATYEQSDSSASFVHRGRPMYVELLSDNGIYQYLRANGASRQTAREAEARDRQRTIDQLIEWYSEGWSWWHVSCDFMGAGDSIGGVDSEDYATTDLSEEIALNVAHQLEKRGFSVLDKPDRHKGHLQNRRESIRQKLLIGTWR